jgi:hypothetical protein
VLPETAHSVTSKRIDGDEQKIHLVCHLELQRRENFLYRLSFLKFIPLPWPLLKASLEQAPNCSLSMQLIFVKLFLGLA